MIDIDQVLIGPVCEKAGFGSQILKTVSPVLIIIIIIITRRTKIVCFLFNFMLQFF